MVLRSTKNNSLFLLVGFIHVYFYPLNFSFFDFNDTVEVRLCVNTSFFNFSFDDLVIAGVDIIIKGSLYPFYFKRRKEAIIYTFFEGIYINRFTKILVCINIILAFWRCS